MQTATPLRTETPAGLLKTRELILAVIISNVAGNLALGHGMHDLGQMLSLSPLPYLHAVLNPWVGAGVVVLALWMFFDLALLSRADLSFVQPVTSAGYILIAILGHFVLGERISLHRWLGIGVIAIGVVIVGETPTRTTPDILEGEVPDCPPDTHIRPTSPYAEFRSGRPVSEEDNP
ncbi:MAG: EamA family transporter [Terriglobales bacterium]